VPFLSALMASLFNVVEFYDFHAKLAHPLQIGKLITKLIGLQSKNVSLWK